MFKDNAVGIIGIGSFVPKRIMHNKELEKMAGVTDKWIQANIGIKTRRLAEKKDAASDLAVNAAKRAIKNATLTINDIDLIVLATSTPDMLFPPTACVVQEKLKARQATAFDVMAVCSGFIFAMDIARRYIENKEYKNALVIGVDIYSKILNWRDRNTCIYFGDGAGAIVLAKVKEGGIISSYLRTDGSGYEDIKILAGGTRMPTTHQTVSKKLHYFYMNPKNVWDFAIKAFPDAVRNVVKKAHLSLNEIDFVVPHQANLNIIKTGMRILGLPLTKALLTIKKYGNTAAASIPITLEEALRKKVIKKKIRLCLLVLGAVYPGEPFYLNCNRIYKQNFN